MGIPLQCGILIFSTGGFGPLRLRIGSIFFGDVIPSLQCGLIVIFPLVLPGRELDLLVRHRLIGNAAQKMRDEIKPGLLLVVGSDDVPGSNPWYL